MKRTIPFLFAALVACSCASTTKVKVNTIYTNGVGVDTLNLVSTMLGPVLQPALPLIDAAAFNGKTNEIADQIMDEQQKHIALYQEMVIEDLKA